MRHSSNELPAEIMTLMPPQDLVHIKQHLSIWLPVRINSNLVCLRRAETTPQPDCHRRMPKVEGSDITYNGGMDGEAQMATLIALIRGKKNRKKQKLYCKLKIGGTCKFILIAKEIWKLFLLSFFFLHFWLCFLFSLFFSPFCLNY